MVLLLVLGASHRPNRRGLRPLSGTGWPTDSRPDDLPKKTEKGSRTVIELLEELVRDHPEVADYRFDLCESYAAFDPHRPGSEEQLRINAARLARAVELAGELADQHPEVPEYAAAHARALHKRGGAHRRMGRRDQAGRCDRAALAILDDLVSRYPRTMSYRLWRASVRVRRADLLARQDRPDEARTLIEANLAELSSLLADQPEAWYLHAPLAGSHRVLAGIWDRLGQGQAARQAHRQARRHHEAFRQGRRRSGEVADREAQAPPSR